MDYLSFREAILHNQYKLTRKQATNMSKTNPASNRLPCIQLHGPKWSHPDDYNNNKIILTQSRGPTQTTKGISNIVQQQQAPQSTLNNHTTLRQQTIAKWMSVTLDEEIEQSIHHNIIRIVQ